MHSREVKPNRGNFFPVRRLLAKRNKTPPVSRRRLSKILTLTAAGSAPAPAGNPERISICRSGNPSIHPHPCRGLGISGGIRRQGIQESPHRFLHNRLAGTSGGTPAARPPAFSHGGNRKRHHPGFQSDRTAFRNTRPARFRTPPHHSAQRTERLSSRAQIRKSSLREKTSGAVPAGCPLGLSARASPGIRHNGIDGGIHHTGGNAVHNR